MLSGHCEPQQAKRADDPAAGSSCGSDRSGYVRFRAGANLDPIEFGSGLGTLRFNGYGFVRQAWVDMAGELLPNDVHVARFDGLEQPLVGVSYVVQVLEGPVVDGQEETQLSLPGVPNGRQDLISRRAVDRAMDTQVRVDAPGSVILRGMMMEPSDRCCQVLPSIRRGESQRRALDRVRFQDGAQRFDFCDCAGTCRSHIRSLEGDAYDEALLVEAMKRLPQGGSADAELGRNPCLSKLTAGSERSVQDRRPHRSDGGLGHGHLAESFDSHRRIRPG
jgi:hypothetical protein